MVQSKDSKEGKLAAPLAPRTRPQYHYFYGSTTDSGAADTLTVATNDTEGQESLIGEVLVSTDNEEETPNSSEHDLQHMLITNGDKTRAALSSVAPEDKPTSSTGLGRALVILFLAASMSTFLIVLIPHTSQPIPEVQSVRIPFEQVDRAEYGDPVEGFIYMDLFHPSLLSPTEPRTFVFPFPTGAFWTNLVVPSSDPEFSYPAVVYPYAYKWSDSSLQISYPAARRVEDKKHHWIVDNFAPELTLSSKEEVSARFVTRYDPLSVTLRFFANTDSKWTTALVQGSPYTTITYLKSTPIVKALSTFKSVQCPGDEAEDFHDFLEDNDGETVGTRRLFGVCRIDEGTEKTTIRGVQFMFTSEEGAYWIMFASEPITLEFDTKKKTTIQGTAPFTGVIRIAYIPAENASDTSTFSSTGLRRLIYHAGAYPTGGDVSWDFHAGANLLSKGKLVNATSSSRRATVQFSFTTQSLTDNSLRPNAAAKGLLMFALPHHAALLAKSVQLNTKRFDLTYRCIKGPLTPIVGSEWSYDEPLLDMEFDGPTQDLDAGVRETILDQISSDMTRILPTSNENVYGYGKQVARLAQLVHIADRLLPDKKKVAEAGKESLVQKGSKLLSSYLENYLSGEMDDYLVFDSNLGGLVSNRGLADKSEDFGNGRYNDHHFHYGYILYACAVMARLDSTFVGRFGSFVDTIFHDVAHPINGNSKAVPSGNAFFPLSRHKSWFDGHSFATGMFAFADGKSQESSSEAVNCYYGAYLWSLVRHGNGNVESDLTDFARLLLAMEIRGAKTYWHMLPKKELNNRTTVSPIYSDTFLENYMVGNVGMLDVTANTWFGNDPLYVHMINAIPITSATAVLFHEDYVKYEYPYLMASRNEVEMPWRGYTISMHAILDPNQAWEDAQSLVSYELDAAISKSQVMYWISQRPAFNVTVNTTTRSSSHASDNSVDASAACTNHAVCDQAGVTGQCCPTAEGTVLGCCESTTPAAGTKALSASGDNSTVEDDEDEETSSANGDDGACTNHPTCVSAGLTGVCCPTREGTFLGCCK